MAASCDISSRRVAAAAGRGKKDRLSDLPDGVLGNTISFVPTTEAGRAAVLSQRWRHMFANVHTLSFEQGVVPHMGDDFTFYFESQERRSLNGGFLDDVNAALLSRRRCGGAAPNASLRAFRVAYDDFHHWDPPMLETWMAHVLQQSSQALDIDLVFQRGQPCRDGSFEYRETNTCGAGPEMPRRIFSCAVLRSLRLGCCRLSPPEDVELPALVTLHLVKINDSNDTIRRIVDSCPRLADLTLEECVTLQRVSVLDRRLRRFAFRCCHGAVRVTLDASELTTLDYKGAVAVPPDSLLVLHGTPRVASSTIEFCGSALSKEEEFVGFRRLLDNFVGASHLHLQSLLLGCSVESEFFPGFPSFSSLQHLELTGSLDNYAVIQAVARIMEQTPSLEVLTLFLTPVAKEEPAIRMRIMDPVGEYYDSEHGSEHEYIDEEHHEQEEDHELVPIHVQGTPNLSACLCLRRQVRQINLVHYTDNDVQRTLAKTLLCNALVLQELRVVFPKERYAWQMTQMENIKGWVVNKSANLMFL